MNQTGISCDSHVSNVNVENNMNPQRFRQHMIDPNRRQQEQPQQQQPFMHPTQQLQYRLSPFQANNLRPMQLPKNQNHYPHPRMNMNMDHHPSSRAPGKGTGFQINGHPNSFMNRNHQFNDNNKKYMNGSPNHRPITKHFNDGGEPMQYPQMMQQPQAKQQAQQHQGPPGMDFNLRKLQSVYGSTMQEEYARQRKKFGFMAAATGSSGGGGNGPNNNGVYPNQHQQHNHPSHRNIMAMRGAAPGTMSPSFTTPGLNSRCGYNGPNRGGMMNQPHTMYTGPNPGPNYTNAAAIAAVARFRQHHTMTMNSTRVPGNNGGGNIHMMTMNNNNSSSNNNNNQQQQHRRPPLPSRNNHHPHMIDSSSHQQHTQGRPEMMNGPPSQYLRLQQQNQMKKRTEDQNGHENLIERTVSIAESTSSELASVLGEGNTPKNITITCSEVKEKPPVAETITADSVEKLVLNAPNNISPCSSINSNSQTKEMPSNNNKNSNNENNSSVSLNAFGEESNKFTFERNDCKASSSPTASSPLQLPSQDQKSINRTSKNGNSEKELDAASILCSLARVTPTAEDISFSSNLLEQSIQGQEENKQGITSVIATKGIYPTRLAISTDSKELNSLHCFVRGELLEIFTVKETKNNTSRATSSSNETIVATVSNDDDNCTNKTSVCSTRVGLRCVHCASEFHKGNNASMSMFYPRRLVDLYKMVCTWQRVHYAKCKHIPPSVRTQYSELKRTDKSRGKTIYWTTSARMIGLVDDEKYGGGVRFLN